MSYYTAFRHVFYKSCPCPESDKPLDPDGFCSHIEIAENASAKVVLENFQSFHWKPHFWTGEEIDLSSLNETWKAHLYDSQNEIDRRIVSRLAGLGNLINPCAVLVGYPEELVFQRKMVQDRHFAIAVFPLILVKVGGHTENPVIYGNEVIVQIGQVKISEAYEIFPYERIQLSDYIELANEVNPKPAAERPGYAKRKLTENIFASLGLPSIINRTCGSDILNIVGPPAGSSLLDGRFAVASFARTLTDILDSATGKLIFSTQYDFHCEPQPKKPIKPTAPRLIEKWENENPLEIPGGGSAVYEEWFPLCQNRMNEIQLDLQEIYDRSLLNDCKDLFAKYSDRDALWAKFFAAWEQTVIDFILSSYTQYSVEWYNWKKQCEQRTPEYLDRLSELSETFKIKTPDNELLNWKDFRVAWGENVTPLYNAYRNCQWGEYDAAFTKASDEIKKWKSIFSVWREKRQNALDHQFAGAYEAYQNELQKYQREIEAWNIEYASWVNKNNTSAEVWKGDMYSTSYRFGFLNDPCRPWSPGDKPECYPRTASVSLTLYGFKVKDESETGKGEFDV